MRLLMVILASLGIVAALPQFSGTGIQECLSNQIASSGASVGGQASGSFQAEIQTAAGKVKVAMKDGVPVLDRLTTQDLSAIRAKCPSIGQSLGQKFRKDYWRNREPINWE